MVVLVMMLVSMMMFMLAAFVFVVMFVCHILTVLLRQVQQPFG